MSQGWQSAAKPSTVTNQDTVEVVDKVDETSSAVGKSQSTPTLSASKPGWVKSTAPSNVSNSPTQDNQASTTQENQPSTTSTESPAESTLPAPEGTPKSLLSLYSTTTTSTTTGTSEIQPAQPKSLRERRAERMLAEALSGSDPGPRVRDRKVCDVL
jgi:hypothetical protein